MAKNKIYYMLLGIGLGLVIASSVNIAFNKPKTVEYTDEEIKEKAKSLGMISIKENIENNEKEDNKKQQKKTDEKVKNEEVKEVLAPQVPVEEVYKEITIQSGESASSIIEKLHTNGLINNIEEFKSLIIKYNFQTKFISGTHQIKANSSYEDIIKMLVKERDLKEVGFL